LEITESSQQGGIGVTGGWALAVEVDSSSDGTTIGDDTDDGSVLSCSGALNITNKL
jgi:hypothetical protein